MKTILVPIDFSDATDRVLATARQFAAAFGSRLILLNVAEPDPDFVGYDAGPPTVRAAVARDFKAERERLETLKTQCEAGGCDTFTLHVQGPIVEKIIRECGEQSADMIVLGSHGHGAFYDLLVGSVTQGVIKQACCPVVVVPAISKN